MLEAAGYPDKKGALTKVGTHLKVPITTLRGWFTAEHNPPPTDIRTEKGFELRAAIQQELESIFGAMPNARQDASFKDLSWAAAVLIDKMQLLDNKPTAILKLQQALEAGQITPEQVKERWPTLAEKFFEHANA